MRGHDLETFIGAESIDSQNPQCEGFYSSRVLFDNKAPIKIKQRYDVTQDGTNIVLHAGAMHGISVGAEFLVRVDGESSRHCTGDLGKIIAQEIDAAT